MNQSLLCHEQRETFSLQKLLYGLSKPRGLLHCSSNYGNLPEGDQDTPAPPSSEPGMSEMQQLFYIILVILVVGTDFLKIYFVSPSVDPAVGFCEALAALQCHLQTLPQVMLCFFHKDHYQTTVAETIFACTGMETS